jgi:hypothetical protein
VSSIFADRRGFWGGSWRLASRFSFAALALSFDPE